MKRLMFLVVTLFVMVTVVEGQEKISSEGTDVFVTAEMQGRQDIRIATSSDEQTIEAAPKTTREKWLAWLHEKGVQEGENANGTIIIQGGEAKVRANPGERKWVVARNAAFGIAELSAKSKLAEFVKLQIESGRFVHLLKRGGETPPPMFQEPLKKLSIADKSRVLAEKGLDNAIKHFDPAWDGTGMTETQKRRKLITMQEQYGAHIAARARLFTSGSFVITNFEGLDEDGDYSVLVGIIWSLKLATIAESVFNPEVHVQPVDPQASIPEQLLDMEKENPNVYCYTNGVRVWTNEKGERVIVSFGSVPASSSITIDRDQATLIARAGIQRFVAELVETKGTLEGSTTYQETASTNYTFDDNEFHRRIDARAKSLMLRGTIPIKSWRGMHPYGGKKIQVVVVTWSPDSYTMASKLEEKLKTQEKRIKRQGGNIPPVRTGGDGAGGSPGAITPKQGASSDPKDF
jgi:hypothetical protein